jgi:hypothetical protein
LTCKLIEDHVSATTAKARVEAEPHKSAAVWGLGQGRHLLLLLLLLLQLLAAGHDPEVCCQHCRVQLTIHVTLAKGVECGGIQLIGHVALQVQHSSSNMQCNLVKTGMEAMKTGMEAMKTGVEAMKGMKRRAAQSCTVNPEKS